MNLVDLTLSYMIDLTFLRLRYFFHLSSDLQFVQQQFQKWSNWDKTLIQLKSCSLSGIKIIWIFASFWCKRLTQIILEIRHKCLKNFCIYKNKKTYKFSFIFSKKFSFFPGIWFPNKVVHFTLIIIINNFAMLH